MKEQVICIFIFLYLPYCLLFGQSSETQYNSNSKDPVPLTLMFHDIGWNALHSFTYNYGLNWIAGGVITYAFIETGIDWKWRNTAYNNDWLSSNMLPYIYTNIGWGVPFITPVALNIAGRITHDNKLQLAGLALAQTAILTAALPSPIKASLGRSKPGIVTRSNNHHVRNPSTDDFSGEFDWFNMNFIDGWPSGHTAQAFAAAAVLTELYTDSLVLKIAAYSYAVLMGMAVSVTTHWASEAVAGALIGYAIGKTTGKSYRRLLYDTAKEPHISFHAGVNTISVVLRF